MYNVRPPFALVNVASPVFFLLLTAEAGVWIQLHLYALNGDFIEGQLGIYTYLLILKLGCPQKILSTDSRDDARSAIRFRRSHTRRRCLELWQSSVFFWK
ncbi:hypothetical protein CDAR_594551 [Caerostris darwini]|uniref:Uncharacterized protein n=1 Tax=Caerostris darwini TaxID=1538125 RepID=A0AAV4WS72_9ARAC|nr:hypothetical protein CDAR_594551 [Caerostris darwini]